MRYEYIKIKHENFKQSNNKIKIIDLISIKFTIVGGGEIKF